MGVSATTLLRQVRQWAVPTPPTPRKLGVDDWALRKGKTYGTLLVDLERHQPVDLLSDRTAATLARWLQEHPGVELITRDRANDYMEGASRGAPAAVQVTDRFHLLQNVRETLQKLLERHQAALCAATRCEPTPAFPLVPHMSTEETLIASPRPPTAIVAVAPSAPVRETKAAQQRALHRSQRLARYQQVRALHAAGLSQRAIVRQLGFSCHVVRHFVQADQFPERATRRPVASKLDPFLPYLRQQLAVGHDNAMQLWRDLRDYQGYTGSRALVSRWVAHHRHLCPTPPADAPKPRRRGKPPLASSESAAHRPRVLSARQAAWLLFRSPEELNEDQEQYRQRLCQHSPNLQTAYALVQEFIGMVRRRTPDTFDDWLARADATHIAELQSFVLGLRRDYAAVKTALSLAESNGQVEGQVNRLKFIKRSMYGRANFDLLRLRILNT
jgi:transposase